MSRAISSAVAVPAAFILAFGTLLPTTSFAQEEEEEVDGEDEELARQLFITGRSFFERAQYARAAEAFEEAYRLSGRAGLLVNLARAQEALGEEAEAVATLERALVDLPAEDDLRATIEPRLNRLRAQVAHEIANAEPADEPVTVPEPPTEVESTPPRSERNDLLWWSGIGAVSVGVIALAASIGTGVASNSVHSDLEDDCPDRVCRPENADDIDRGESLAVASTVLLGVGLVASAAGVVMMILSLGGEEEAESNAVHVTGGPGTVGAGVAARF
ncbi:MAG: hypothetical protein AAGF12_34240 [Myxococcota bacterium]